MPGICADPMAQHLAGDEDLHCPIFHGLGFLPKRIARPFTFYSRVIRWPFRKKKQTHTKKQKNPTNRKPTQQFTFHQKKNILKV